MWRNLIKGKLLYLITFVLLFATVPWIFVKPDFQVYLGLPDWGLYSIVISALYAVAVFIYIAKYWKI